jgi:uncharacterized protein (DUF427 family)
MERCHKRVRAYLDGALVADTRDSLLVWEKPYYPTYYLPVRDVRAELVASGTGRETPGFGHGTLYDVVLPGGKAAGAACRYHGSDALRDMVRLRWSAMDEWFEEDEPVYVHPRSPYVRVDILDSSRHVVVELDGVTLAESRRPRILFETGLRPRYYLPRTDLRTDLLRASDTVTQCPYKGTANYWHAVIGDTVHEDLVWCYRSPLPESQKIAGLVCFYDERVDLWLDGERQHRR